MHKRTSALAVIKDVGEWKVMNTIFDMNTSEFDEAFSSEHGLNPKYYIEHYIEATGPGESFEDKMCKNLFAGHGNPDSKLYLLRGNLGTGKTSFAHYMGKTKLPDKFDNVLFLYINCYHRFPAKFTKRSDFEHVFRRNIRQSLVNKIASLQKEWQFSTEASLAQAILKSRGVIDESDLRAINEFDNSNSDILLPFLLNECELDRVLICVDNMDDCSSDVKEVAFSFAQSLSDIAMECEERSRSNVSILVPLRYYTNISTDTEGYPKIDIPTHSVSDIMVVKIEHVKDLIDSNCPCQTLS